MNRAASYRKARIFKDDIEKELLCDTPMRGSPYSIIEYFQGRDIQKVVSDTKNSQNLQIS
jgi:hypothetical protein